MSLTLDIPAEGPLFAGHFPGHPILPGVTEIVLAVEAIAAARGITPVIAAMPFARLRQLVRPGDRLTVDAKDTASGGLRLDLRRAGEAVANAEVVLGAPGAIDASEKSIRIEGPRAAPLPPLDALMPHRPPMRFVTGVRVESDRGLECDAKVPADCALVRNGAAPAIAAVEAAAQAAALWEAVRRVREGAGGGPRVGYLVALKDIAFGAATIAADRPFEVTASLDAVALPLTHYAVEARVDGRIVARGRVATVLAGE